MLLLDTSELGYIMNSYIFKSTIKFCNAPENVDSKLLSNFKSNDRKGIESCIKDLALMSGDRPIYGMFCHQLNLI